MKFWVFTSDNGMLSLFFLEDGYLWGLMGVWRQISEYFYLRKRDPEAPRTKWMKYMHGINRLSFIIFLICLIILAIKLLR